MDDDDGRIILNCIRIFFLIIISTMNCLPLLISVVLAFLLKNNLGRNLIASYNLDNTNNHELEDIRIEITKHNKKYIVGSIYRHLNQSITEFKSMLDVTLSKMSHQRHPFIIAGDFNINLLQWETPSAVKDYLDIVIINNFVDTAYYSDMTSNSSTLIDHITKGTGTLNNEFKTKSGILVSDISDNLPNYFLLSGSN